MLGPWGNANNVNAMCAAHAAVKGLGLVGDLSVWWHVFMGLVFVITLPAVAPTHQTSEYVHAACCHLVTLPAQLWGHHIHGSPFQQHADDMRKPHHAVAGCNLCSARCACNPVGAAEPPVGGKRVLWQLSLIACCCICAHVQPAQLALQFLACLLLGLHMP